jgi:uncharacterized protein (TIGR04255 family)
VDGHPPVLRNSPLEIVALELRFPEAVLLQEDLKKIRRGLAKDYPASDTEHGIGIEVSVQGISQQQTLERHVYRTRDGAHQIALTSASLTLEARGPRQYEGFEHFLERWLKALEVVAPIAEIEAQLRLGLRYVNQLPVSDVSAGLEAVADRINPILLSPSGAEGFAFFIATSFQELRMQIEDAKASIRHGLRIVQEGSPSSGVYLLDIDLYDDEMADYDRETQIERLKLFNFQAWNLFRWALSDAEYERMEPEERS